MSEQAHVREIGMPRLSDSMEEATVTRWLKRPGDAVARGEELVEVETDKATVVYEAEFAGVLDEILVDEGGTAALGAPIARLRTAEAGPAPVAQPVAVAGCGARGGGCHQTVRPRKDAHARRRSRGGWRATWASGSTGLPARGLVGGSWGATCAPRHLTPRLPRRLHRRHRFRQLLLRRPVADAAPSWRWRTRRRSARSPRG